MNKTEKEHNGQIHFLESLEHVDRVIKREVDAEKLLWAVVQAVFEILGVTGLGCCILAIRKRPRTVCRWRSPALNFPGAGELNLEVPMKPGADEVCRALLASMGRSLSVLVVIIRCTKK